MANIDPDLIAVQYRLSTTLEAFPDDAPRSYTYNGDGTLATEVAAWNGALYLKTYGYTTGKLTSDSGWVKIG